MLAPASAIMNSDDNGGDDTPDQDAPRRRSLARRLLDGLRGTVPSPAPDTSRRLGRYRILHKIGEGGMGVVFAAEDEALGRRVAVKTIMEPSESTRRRFRREARAAAAVNHPNICQVYEIGEDGGQLFIAMELLAGESLTERLDRGPMTLAEVLSLGRGVLAALAALHDAGIVHRDLKPSNIFLTPHGVKLLDFGLARPLPEELTQSIQAGTVLTQPGVMVGTPRYMAPEQVLGKEVDARTDLFAAAAILYESVTGRPAFPGETVVQVLSTTLHDQPPAIVGEAAGLDEVLRHALEKQPDDRPATAAEMMAAIDGVVAWDAAPVSRSGPDAAASIAVLPFVNLSSDEAQDYFCEGMAEDVLNALTKVAGLRVVARASSFRFAGRSHDIGDIGRTLGVEQILEGSVRTSGTRLRVTAQLIRARDSSQLWSERYDRQQEDVFAIQDEISENIVEALRIRLVGTNDKASPSRRETQDVEAYHLYLKGQHNWYRRESDSLRKAASFFEKATQRDPSYALAHVGLANACSSLGYYGAIAPARAQERAEAAIARALAVDPELAEAHAARGLMQMWQLWDWDGAAQSFRTSIDRNPEYVLSRIWYSFLLDVRGRHDEAIAMAQSARALDPLSPYTNSSVAFSLLNQGQYREAIEAGSRALEMEPDFLYSLWVLGGSHTGIGQHEEALSALNRAATLSDRAPYYLGWLAYALGKAGRRERALAIIDELGEMARSQYVAPTFFAWAYVGLGEMDKALDWIDEACEQKSPSLTFHHDTLFAGLRDNERFRDFRKRIGLAP